MKIKCQAQTPARAPLNSTVRAHHSLLLGVSSRWTQWPPDADNNWAANTLRFRGAPAPRRRTDRPGQVSGSAASLERAPEINRKSGVGPRARDFRRVKVSVVAPLGWRRHPPFRLRQAPFDPVSPKLGIRQRRKWSVAQSASSRKGVRALTPRWSGRVHHKVPSSYVGVRAAQLNR